MILQTIKRALYGFLGGVVCWGLFLSGCKQKKDPMTEGGGDTGFHTPPDLPGASGSPLPPPPPVLPGASVLPPLGGMPLPAGSSLTPEGPRRPLKPAAPSPLRAAGPAASSFASTGEAEAFLRAGPWNWRGFACAATLNGLPTDFIPLSEWDVRSNALLKHSWSLQTTAFPCQNWFQDPLTKGMKLNAPDLGVLCPFRVLLAHWLGTLPQRREPSGHVSDLHSVVWEFFDSTRVTIKGKLLEADWTGVFAVDEEGRLVLGAEGSALVLNRASTARIFRPVPAALVSPASAGASVSVTAPVTSTEGFWMTVTHPPAQAGKVCQDKSLDLPIYAVFTK